MKTLVIISTLLSLIACSTSNLHDISQCDTTTFELDNTKNDTSKVVYLSAVVFDTTLCIIQGYLYDQLTSLPLKNSIVTLTRESDRLVSKTNENGKFEISRSDLRNGKWDLNISLPKYKCLLIKDVCKFENSFGEILIKFKLRRK